MKKRPIIALLTDFGAIDGYVAAMKGVILSRHPDAVLIDISHAIPRHDIGAGAYVLWSVHRDFPPGTAFLAVVDPGVGGERRLLCTRADGRTFLHPDNGILDLVLADAKRVMSVRLTNRRFHRRQVSDTFHGRDILAPVAASILAGTALRSLGPRSAPAEAAVAFRRVDADSPGRYRGSVLHIDHFGNIITNFSMTALPTSRISVTLGRSRIRSAHTCYADAAAGRPFLLLGSSGLVEIAVRNGSAASGLRASSGMPAALLIGGSR